MDNREFKDSTKAAAAYLAEHGIEVPHTRLLEALSRALGQRNWSTLSAQLKGGLAAVPQEEPQAAAWQPEQGRMSDEQYVRSAGAKCPFCGSTNVESHGVEADGPDTWDNNECHACGSTWTAAYKLAGYYNAVAGEHVSQTTPAPVAGDQADSVISRLKDNHVIVVCALSHDREDWLGYIFSAKAALSVLAANLGGAQRSMVKDAPTLWGEFAHDEDDVVTTLLEAHIRPLWQEARFDEPSVREAILGHLSQYELLEPVRDEVVNEMVDDVKDRALKYGFGYSSWNRALELSSASSDLLNLDASEAELKEAARRLT